MHATSPHRNFFHFDDESPSRSLGIAAALALHLGAALALFGAGESSIELPQLTDTEIEVEWIEPEKPLEAQPVPPMPVAPRPPEARPRERPLPTPQTPPVVVETAEFSQPIVQAPPPVVTSAPIEPSSPSSSGPIEAGQLAYAGRPRPPRYPPPALRAGQQGTVLLRILVDSRGQPLRVEIERSSGHRLLDRAAVDYARRELRFVPAQVDGRAVQAYAQVPVDFRLPGAG
jgi:protein TonB